MRLAVCLMSGAALLAACSPKSEPARAGPAAAPAASAAVSPAAQSPKRKPGLWETTMSGGGMGDGSDRTFTTKMCLDAAADSLAPIAGRRFGHAPNCTQASASTPGGFTFDSTCKRGERTITTHAVATGDFNSAYKVEVSTRVEPAREGRPGERQMTLTSKWLGACPPDMKPGDVSTSGMKYNLNDGPPPGMGGGRWRERGEGPGPGPGPGPEAK